MSKSFVPFHAAEQRKITEQAREVSGAIKWRRLRLSEHPKGHKLSEFRSALLF